MGREPPGQVRHAHRPRSRANRPHDRDRRAPAGTRGGERSSLGGECPESGALRQRASDRRPLRRRQAAGPGRKPAPRPKRQRGGGRAVPMGGTLVRAADAPRPGDRSQDSSGDRDRLVDCVSRPPLGQLWVADSLGGAVSRVDAATGIAKPIPVAGRPADIALGADADLGDTRPRGRTGPDRSGHWIGSPHDPMWDGARPVSRWGAGAVWVANSGDGTVSKVDPRTGDVTETIQSGLAHRTSSWPPDESG